MRFLPRAALVAAWLAGVSPRSAAGQSVSFDDAVGWSSRAPEVRAAEEALRARERGDARIARTTETTRVYVVPGVRVLSRQDRGLEGQVQIGHGLNLGRLGRARMGTARDERGVLDARARAVALARRLDAAHGWVVLYRQERLLESAHAHATVAADVVARVRRAAEAGAMTAADVAEAEALEAEARIATYDAEAARIDAQILLGEAMGLGDTETLRTTGEPPSTDVPDPIEIERRLSEVERRPGVVAARLAALAVRARDVEARAERAPRLEADLMVYRESPRGLMVFPQVGVVFGARDLAARERSRLAEERARLEGDAGEAALDARREAHLVAHDVEHCRRTAEALERSLVPTLTRLVAMRERQLAAREVTVLVALDARRRLLRAEADLVRAKADRAWAEIRAFLSLSEIDAATEGSP